MTSPLRTKAVYLLSILAVLLAIWFTPGLWSRLDGWVQNQRDRVWSKLESALGQKVVYDRIGPSVLSALDFQNVRLLADDGTTLFQAASVRLSLDWERVFQGRFSEALRRIQVINAVATLDSHRDQAILQRWAGFFQPSSQGGNTSFDFQVEGFNVALRWIDGPQRLTLDRGFAVLSPEGREWGIKFRGALAWENRSSQTMYARSLVRGVARSDAGFQNLSARADLGSVRTSWFDLEPTSVQITVAPSRITIAKVSDRTPFDLQATWSPATQQWQFQGAAEEFRPSQLIRIKGNPSWGRMVDGLITGRFAYRLGGDFSFSGRAQWPPGVLPAPFDTEPLAIEGTVASRDGLYLFQGFHLETTQVSLGFEGDLGANALPEGNLTVERFRFGEGYSFQGSAQLVRTGSVVSFQGQDWKFNTLGTLSPTGWVEKTPSGWSFSIQGPWDGADTGRFAALGTFSPDQQRLSAAFDLVNLPLSVLRDNLQGFLPGLELPQQFQSLEASSHGFVEWAGSDGLNLSLTSFSIHDTLTPGRLGRGSARFEGRHLDLTIDEGVWDLVPAKGTLSVDFEDEGVINGTLTGSVWDRPFDVSGRWVPTDRTLVFSGKPGIAGMVHQNNAGVWIAQVNLDPIEVLPGWTVGFQGKATLDGVRWEIEAERVTLGGRYPWNQEAFSARAKVKADLDFIRLEGLVVNDSHGSWAGAAMSSWSLDFSTLWAGRLALKSSSAKETLTLDWVASALDRWHFSVKASGLDVTRASIPQLNGLVGRLTLGGEGDWNGSEASWNLQAALSEGRYGDSPLGFRATFSGTNRKLAVRNLNFSLPPLRVVDGSLDLNALTRNWQASLGVGLRVGTSDWESRWALTGAWTPEGTPLRVSGTLTARSNSWAQRSFPNWRVSGFWSPDSWEAALGGGEVLIQGGSQGNFTVEAQAPFPVQGEAEGTWTSGTLSLGVRNFRANLTLLKDFFDTPFIRIGSGVARGDFVVGGNLSDLEINGSMTLQGLSVTSSFLRQPLGLVDVPVVFEGHRLRVDSLNIGPPGQVWLFSGGARLDHLFPEEYQFSIQTDALSAIPFSYQFTGISAIGNAGGLLILKGTPFAITVGGRLVLQDTVITLKPESPESSSGEPLGFNADLTLITGRKVEFLWPNETLPLLRAVANPGQSLAIKANDVASTWSLVGKLGLKTGEINYLNRVFVLKEGLLTLQEDQTSFDPRILVRAEWKFRETSGTVIINLRADGTLSRFSPRFDAVPYKTTEELQQLVGTTLALPTDYTKTNVDTALSVASDVGTSFLLSPLEDAVRRNFHLDLFTLKTEVLKKTLLNRNGALDASSYLDNTRLFFGKYIGDDLFLQGTLAFRQDTTIATQVSPKMVVEPEFQMEFQTPFFLLNWTLLPQHPETLFVTDNTVTFRWNWSY